MILRMICSTKASVMRFVDQDVPSDGVAGLHGTQKSARCAEFVGVPEPLGGIGGPDLLRHLAYATQGIPGQCREVRFQPIGIEGTGQQIVNGHVVFGGRSRSLRRSRSGRYARRAGEAMRCLLNLTISSDSCKFITSSSRH